METNKNEILSPTEKINTYLTPFMVAFSGFYWTYKSRLENKFEQERQYYRKYGYTKKVNELRSTQSNARIVFNLFQLLIVGIVAYLVISA